MPNSKEIPAHTAKVVQHLVKGLKTFNQLQNAIPLCPSTLSRILRFLRSNGLIDTIPIPSDTQKRMKKAYLLTTIGKETVPIWTRLEETEVEILRFLKE